jgi:hypothetical protein
MFSTVQPAHLQLVGSTLMPLSAVAATHLHRAITIIMICSEASTHKHSTAQHSTPHHNAYAQYALTTCPDSAPTCMVPRSTSHTLTATAPR